MVQTSATFPILLLLWIPTDDRLFPMARTLGDAVNKLNGQIQLSCIDIASQPIDRAGVPGAGRTGAVRADRRPPDADSCRGCRATTELQQIVDQVMPKLICGGRSRPA